MKIHLVSERIGQIGRRLVFPALLMVIAGAEVAVACPLAVDNAGNYSPAEHVRCLRQAAEEGDAISQDLLAQSYFNGDETPRDYEEAAKWFSRAAEQGHPVAQFMLASMYLEGQGVPVDIVRAQMWLTLSAAQGIDYAKEARDLVEKKMTRAQIADAQKLARDWKPKPEKVGAQ
jgi:TPR repeat protein